MAKRIKVYVSGQVSGKDLGEVRNRFMLAAASLQMQGYRTCNPLRMRLCEWLARKFGTRRDGSRGWGYKACILMQLLWMSATCDAIYLLKGWHLSDGARAERSVARCMGLKAIYEEEKPKKKSHGKEKA